MPSPGYDQKKVLIAYKSLPRYRIDFFETLRIRLGHDGIRLDLTHGDATGDDAARRDTGSLTWATYAPNLVLPIFGHELIWQRCFRQARHFDLVIVEQASRLAVNYPLLAQQQIGIGKVAFWGHGANLQSHRPHGASELVKRLISRWPHWWFAYTDGSRRRVEQLGYPPERITIVQNAIDTGKLRAARSRLGSYAASAVRRRLGLGNGPVAAFVGGLYEDKRIEFLLEASDIIAHRRPDFRLLIVGDGPLRKFVQKANDVRPHVRYIGPLFDEEKVAALAPASALLLPGLVGLAILDAFALETPLVTTAVKFHSPEIEYLADGHNGVMVKEVNDAEAYASAVLRVLEDSSLSERLKAGCRASARRYTNEEMVERFATGVVRALMTA